MNIGVMSDTHGNRKLMHRVADQMRQDAGVTLIIHLGDNFEDAEELRDYGHTVHMVPGLWCPEYRNNRVPKTTLDSFDGVSIACAHAEDDLQEKAQQADVVLVGHTHCGKIEQRGDVLWLNPGTPQSPHQPQPATDLRHSVA